MFRVVSACAACGAAFWLFAANIGHSPESRRNAAADLGQIAFGSHRDGNWEVYVTDADGRNQRRLTRRNGHTRFPLWSPDRAQIAFATQQGDPVGGWEFWS